MLISDHLAIPNLAGPLNALFGPTISPDYPRFVPLSDAYSRRVRKVVLHSAYELGQKGVFGTLPRTPCLRSTRPLQISLSLPLPGHTLKLTRSKIRIGYTAHTPP